MPGTFSRSLKIIKIFAPSPAIPRVGLVNTKSRGRIDSHFATATRCWLPPDSGMTVVSVPCGLILSHVNSWLTTAPSVCRCTQPPKAKQAISAKGKVLWMVLPVMPAAAVASMILLGLWLRRQAGLLISG